MSGVSALLLGLGLGLRHATDPDHVVVISTLIQRSPGLSKATRVAASWGAGHTLAFLAVGLLIILSGIRLPPSFDRAAEVVVALMLVGLGLAQLVRKPRFQEQPQLPYARSALVGLVHGLAGSAGIALVAMATIESRLWAATYLVVFGLGTVLGMVLLTMALSVPLAWLARHDREAQRWTARAAAVFSILLGAFLLWESLTPTA